MTSTVLRSLARSETVAQGLQPGLQFAEPASRRNRAAFFCPFFFFFFFFFPFFIRSYF